MEMKAEKQRIVKKTITSVLAASIILGSVVTAAALQQDDKQALNSTNAAAKTKIEFELPNGDIVVGHNADLDVSVNVIKAFTVTVNNRGKQQIVMLAKGTVNDALEKAGINTDNVVSVPSGTTEITGDTAVTLYDAKRVDVKADGETHNVLLPKGNVVKSLNLAGFNVSADDILDVSKDSDVWDTMSITIQRVRYGEETTTEKIAYDEVKKNSDKIELGETKVATEGKDGKKLVTKKCRYVDGKKVSEKTVRTYVSKKPVDKVTLVGTKGAAKSGAAGTFTDSNGNKVSYKRLLTGSGTAYTAPSGAGTATGVTAYHGGVAVNPNIIPYGSKLYIVSTDGSFVYGYATAVDTGGALMEGSAVVDCFYNTYNECVNFGRRNVNVYVIG